MSSTLALQPFTDVSPLPKLRGPRWRDWARSLPHRHAWPAPLSNDEAAILRRLPRAIRQRPIADFAETSQHRVHLGHLQNRRIGVLTVGDCVDAELARDLGTWPGVGPTVALWLRGALLKLATDALASAGSAAPVPVSLLQPPPQPKPPHVS